MSKNKFPHRKLMLVSYSTDREVDGEMRRVKYKAKSVVDLTDDELAVLDRLTIKTGKLHYRDPIREGGETAASEPEVVVVPDYAGQDIALDKKNVDLLKAYLDFHSVGYDAKATKADLLGLAEAQEKALADAGTGGAQVDPDAGL